MGKPFSDLEKQALRLLAGGGDPLTGNDEELRKYWKWRINPADSSHDLPDASTRTTGRQTNEIGITPFGMDLAVNQYARVIISQRSAAFYDSKKSELGHKIINATNIGIPLEFTPAKIYARRGASATPTQKISRITGRKYKTKFSPSDEGFSAPFGIKTAGESIAVRQAVLATEIGALASVGLVTFTPERFKS
jgi:hypothetical protein